MVAFEHRQCRIVERLNSQTDSIHAGVGENGDLVFTHASGIGFDAELSFRCELKPVVDKPAKLLQLAGCQLSRRAAAEKDGVQF